MWKRSRKEPVAGRPGPRATKTDWLLALWVLGCAAVATRFLLGAGRASWMAPRAAEARHAGAMLEELRRALAATLDTVRQWQYQPTLLNGQPVEVVTTITVDFQLGQ
jgi:hypothetical protein